jgi:hypothetical protein
MTRELRFRIERNQLSAYSAQEMSGGRGNPANQSTEDSRAAWADGLNQSIDLGALDSLADFLLLCLLDFEIG